MRQLLAERAALVGRLRSEGRKAGEVDRGIRAAGLSYASIATTFEVSKSYVRWVVLDLRRVQVAVRERRCA